MAELADAQDSGSCEVKLVEVRFLSSAPSRYGDLDEPGFGRAFVVVGLGEEEVLLAVSMSRWFASVRLGDSSDPP